MAKLKMNCTQEWQEDDESTNESSKVEDELKNLFDFDDFFGVTNWCEAD